MHYKIVYGTDPHTQKHWSFLRQQMLIASFMLLCLFLISILWPQGKAVLQQYLIMPPNVVDPVRQLIDGLENGDAPMQAVFTFCEELFSGTR